jgi:uncharacterized protein YqeY
MTLKERISTDYIKAFKEKNTATKNLLSVIKGDIQTVEKNTGSANLPDEDVIKILNKTAKSLKETIAMSDDLESQAQLAIVVTYLPQAMSREEISFTVKTLVESGVKDIGGIMKAFANLPADKKMVSEVIREIVK